METLAANAAGVGGGGGYKKSVPLFQQSKRDGVAVSIYKKVDLREIRFLIFIFSNF